MQNIYNTERYHYIDYLRVIAILMMFIYHTSMVFVDEWEWLIQDAQRSRILLEINYWMSFFRMPLLFFVSAYISCVLLNRLNWLKYTQQRFMRLIIPTVICTFLLVAPQIYFSRKLQGMPLSYIEFYASFLEFKWWPTGNFHWMHLWFIPYLFFYNILSIPIHYYLNKKDTRVELLGSYLCGPYKLIVFSLLAVLPYTFLRTHYPASHDFINDYARHSFFIPFILAGLLFFRFKQATQTLEDKRQFFFRLAFLSIITINIIRWNDLKPFDLWDNWIDKPQTYLYLILLGFNTWMWVFTCIGYARKYLNHGSALLSYCNTAVYPFYILHQTLIVIIAYYVVQTDDNIALKYFFLLTVSFALCICCYHLLIRPYKAMCFVFGMKHTRHHL